MSVYGNSLYPDGLFVLYYDLNLYLLIKEVKFLPNFFVRFLIALTFQSNLQAMPPLMLQNGFSRQSRSVCFQQEKKTYASTFPSSPSSLTRRLNHLARPPRRRGGDCTRHLRSGASPAPRRRRSPRGVRYSALTLLHPYNLDLSSWVLYSLS
jgi:hypothetical protein